MNTSMPTSIVFDFGGVIFPVEPNSGSLTTPEERREISSAMRSIAESFDKEIQRGDFLAET